MTPSGSTNESPAGQTRAAAGSALFPCQEELVDLFELLVNVMFCAKHTDSRYVAVNQAFVHRTGRSSKRDVIGRKASDLFSPPLAERYEEQDRRVFDTGEPLRDELELIRRVDGSLGWYLTTKLPVASRSAPDELMGLVSISRDLQTPNVDGIAMDSLTRVVEYVNLRLDETIRVAELASIAGWSPSQLERRMKKVFGLSATQYVLRVRVDRAAKLLTETDMALVDVATSVGFYDQADFTRRFARLTNETPAQFRNRHGS